MSFNSDYTEPQLILTIDMGHQPDLLGWLQSNVPAEELSAYTEVHNLSQASENDAISKNLLTVSVDSTTHVVTMTFPDFQAYVQLDSAKEYFLHPKHLEYRIKRAQYYENNLEINGSDFFFPEY